MRPLLIPYAIDLDRDVQISADEIAEVMLDPRSTLRPLPYPAHFCRCKMPGSELEVLFPAGGST